MIEVASIKGGIVIDHITAGKGLLIFNKLNLAALGYPVVLLINVPSERMGKKDIIKIENYTQVDTAMLGLIDPSITVNIIESEHVIKKVQVSIPEEVKGLFACSNPR
ncbi:MAG: aspartate carbamoyltransferase regulatory subunit, partial [Bacillota bacterium]|nr:aspartate carbamoyltransferase regulatory subunit [Bacillota bacterium]